METLNKSFKFYQNFEFVLNCKFFEFVAIENLHLDSKHRYYYGTGTGITRSCPVPNSQINKKQFDSLTKQVGSEKVNIKIKG